MQAPSASNSVGTVLGTLAGAAVVSMAPSWPFVIAMAGALSLTPIGVAGILAVGVTALVNYAATHYAEVKDLNDLVARYWPQIQASYPGKDGAPPTNVSNINKS